MIRLLDEPMSRHTTFKIGGNAKTYIVPETEDELIGAIRECEDAKEHYYIIGNGSNLLVSDEGFDGTIIEIGKAIGDIELIGETEIEAKAGASLASIAALARDNSLSGFEFAGGIPGTLGGACIMNAGAYDGEMKMVLKSVRLLDPKSGKILTQDAGDLDLGYRHSNIPERGLIVLSAVIALSKGNRDEIALKMNELNQRRRDKQPLEYPSAGSTFKRPTGYFAGKLIQDAGMQGYQVGGARVSDKHAGFVINVGQATCEDVLKLTDDVSEAVKKAFGVDLEREIKVLK